MSPTDPEAPLVFKRKAFCAFFFADSIFASHVCECPHHPFEETPVWFIARDPVGPLLMVGTPGCTARSASPSRSSIRPRSRTSTSRPSAAKYTSWSRCLVQRRSCFPHRLFFYTYKYKAPRDRGSKGNERLASKGVRFPENESEGVFQKKSKTFSLRNEQLWVYLRRTYRAHHRRHRNVLALYGLCVRPKSQRKGLSIPQTYQEQSLEIDKLWKQTFPRYVSSKRQKSTRF